MEQFLTGDVWKEVNPLLSKKQKKTACIADVQGWNTGSYIYNIRSNEKGVISGGVFVVAH